MPQIAEETRESKDDVRLPEEGKKHLDKALGTHVLADLLVDKWDDQTFADAYNDVDGSYLGRHEDLVGTAGQGRLGATGGSAETVTRVSRGSGPRPAS